MKPLVDPVSPLRPDRRGKIYDGAACAGVVLAALALRSLYLLQLSGSPLAFDLGVDPSYYLGWARRIAAGDWLSGREVFEQSPLYAYILALVFRLLGEDLLTVRILQACAGALTAGLVFLSARKAFGRPSALAAGILFAIYGPAIFYDGMIMKTVYAVLMTAAMTACLLYSEGSRRALLVLAGACLGVAALFRDNLILLAPLLAGWLALDVRLRSPLTSGRLREAATRVLLFAAGTVAAILPVTARNLAVSGEPVLLTAGGGEVFYIGNNPAADGKYSPPPFVRAAEGVEHEDFRREAERRAGRPLSRSEASSYWVGEGIRWILSDPGGWLSLLGRKALVFSNSYEQPDNQNFYHHRVFAPILRVLPTWALLLPLAAAGAAISSRHWRNLLPLYLIGGGYFLTVMLFFNFARFRMPLVPVLILFAGEGIGQAFSLARRPGRLLIAAIPAAACAALALAPAGNDPFHRGQAEVQLASLYARAGRHQEALESSRSGIALLESIYTGTGALLGDGGHGVQPVRSLDRPKLGASYYGVLSEAYAERGRLSRTLDDPDEALVWLDRAVDATPEPRFAFSILAEQGEIFLQAGRLEEAEDYLNRAYMFKPGDFRLTLLLGQILYRTGRLQEARQLVESALATTREITPLALADANYALGLIHRELGETARMRFHFGETLRKNPAHPRAGWMRRVLSESDAAAGTR